MRSLRILVAVAMTFAAQSVFAQGAQVSFGSTDYDPSAPVEVTADGLSVDQEDGTAVFEGNVLVGQGELRLTANALKIEYGDDANGKTEVTRLVATGGVTVVNGPEAAEAQDAVYTIADREIVMSGAVVITQGLNALSGDRLTVNLDTGAGQMEGRVRTVIRTDEQ